MNSYVSSDEGEEEEDENGLDEEGGILAKGDFEIEEGEDDQRHFVEINEIDAFWL